MFIFILFVLVVLQSMALIAMWDFVRLQKEAYLSLSRDYEYMRKKANKRKEI